MAQSEPVKVVVDLVDKFSKDLKELEAKLEKIDGKKLEVGLDIDDDGSIEKIKGQLKDLEKSLDSSLKIDVKGFEAALAKKKTLEKDMYSTLHLKTRGGGGAPGVGAGMRQMKGPPMRSPLDSVVQKSVVENLLAVEGATDLRPKSSGLSDDPTARAEADRIIRSNVPGPNTLPDFSKEGGQGTATSDFMSAIRKGTSFNPDIDASKMFGGGRFGSLEIQAKGFDPDLFMSGRGGGTYPFSRRQRAGRGIRKVGGMVAGAAGGVVGMADEMDLGEMTGGFGQIMKKLGKFKPNIMMVWNFLALLIPVLVTLAGAAIGAAAALVGLAAAGGAIVGLGLLGYGENAADSMDKLKDKIGEVKSELFDALRPAFKAMNPIVDEWLDGLAGAAKKLVDPLTRLAGFEGFLGGVGGGILNWVIGFLNVISDLRPRIEAIGSVLGRVFGNLNIMEWGIDEIYDNMGAFLQLGGILMSLIVIIYNVSKAIGFALSPFAPLFKMVASLSDLLANKWVSATLSALAAVLLLYGALVGLNMLFAKLTYTAIAATLTSLGALIKAFILLTINMLRTAGAGISSMITGLFGLAAAALSAIGVVGALNAALAATVALIAATGLGALLVLVGGAIGGAVLGKTHASAGDLSGSGSGYGGYGGGMGAGGGGSTINIYGDVGNSEYQKMKDNFGSMYDEQSNVNSETDK